MDDKEGKEEIELEINKFDVIALGRRCFICNGIFTKEIIDDSVKLSKKGLKNIPVRMHPLPGFVHRRCRGNTTGDIMNNPVAKTDLSNEVGNL